MRARWLAFVLIGTVVAGACGRAQDAPSRAVPEAPAPMADEQAAQLQTRGYAQDAKRAPTAAPVAEAQALGPVEALLASRKLIRTGQITLEVGKYASAAEAAARIAAQHGGYVADTRVSRSDSGRHTGSLVLRIPADRFADALKALRELGTVRSENVSAQDVTKAYADLETRLKVKRETLERLRDILRRQTGKLSDVLEAEREIARVTEEIEQMEGERRYYDQQVALSTVTVGLVEPEPFATGGSFAPIREAFRDSLEVFAESLGAMIYALSAGIPWVVAAWVGWKAFRFLRRRR
jgi:hypothetical protein